MLDGNKKLYTLTQSSNHKDAGLFKFLWHFGTTHHERANKIHVHGFTLGTARNY